MSMASIVPFASPTVALVAAFFARRSSRAARQSLQLVRKTGQAAYETARAAHTPAVSLFLTEVQYRRPQAAEEEGIIGAEAARWVEHGDADSIEVVIRGRLVNNLPQEILLTCRDHPDSGRKLWYSYRNQSVFLLGSTEVELGRAVLSAGEEVAFTWIDRKPKNDWVDIYRLYCQSIFNDRDLRLPDLTPREVLSAVIHRYPLGLARRDKVKRIGFRLVCEPRTQQRVATVWRAEVCRAPVEVTGRDQDNRVAFGESLETFTGPPTTQWSTIEQVPTPCWHCSRCSNGACWPAARSSASQRLAAPTGRVRGPPTATGGGEILSTPSRSGTTSRRKLTP